MYKIKAIEIVRLNGKNCKLFEAWEVKDGCEIFAGRFTAPAKTANKNLANFIVE